MKKNTAPARWTFTKLTPSQVSVAVKELDGTAVSGSSAQWAVEPSELVGRIDAWLNSHEGRAPGRVAVHSLRRKIAEVVETTKIEAAKAAKVEAAKELVETIPAEAKPKRTSKKAAAVEAEPKRTSKKAAAVEAEPKPAGEVKTFVAAEHPDGFVCRTCGEFKPLPAFPKRSAGAGKERPLRQTRCRFCREVANGHRDENGEITEARREHRYAGRRKAAAAAPKPEPIDFASWTKAALVEWLEGSEAGQELAELGPIKRLVKAELVEIAERVSGQF